MRSRANSLPGRLAQSPVARDAAAEHDRRRRLLSLSRLNALQQRIDDGLLVAGRQVRALLLGQRGPLPHLVEQRGLDAAEAEVEAGCTRSRKSDSPRIARCRELVNRRAAGEWQTEDPRTLVEGLPCCIVEGAANHRDVAVLLAADKVAVPARHHEAEQRRTQLRLLKLSGEDVSGQVTDADDRQFARPGNRLRHVDPDQQAAHQAGTAGHGDRIDLLPAGAGGLERSFDHRDEGLQVRARRDLRNDAAEGGVQLILRPDDIRQKPWSTRHNGRGRFIAGGLDRQDAPVGGGYWGVLVSSPSKSSVCRMSLNRFLKLGAWIESDHMTIASSLLSV